MRYYVYTGEEERREIEFEERSGGLHVRVRRPGEEAENAYKVDYRSDESGEALHLLLDGRSYDLFLNPSKDGFDVHLGPDCLGVEVIDERELSARSVRGTARSGALDVFASMPGIVVSIEVEVGQSVVEGQTLLVLEAMKMQNPVLSDGSGVIQEIHVHPGQAVGAGDALLRLS